jgi:hypothetical protein
VNATVVAAAVDYADCIEWHVDGDPARLAALVHEFDLTEPRQLRGLWFMARKPD